MHQVWGSNKHTTVHDLARHATSLPNPTKSSCQGEWASGSDKHGTSLIRDSAERLQKCTLTHMGHRHPHLLDLKFVEYCLGDCNESGKKPDTRKDQAWQRIPNKGNTNSLPPVGDTQVPTRGRVTCHRMRSWWQVYESLRNYNGFPCRVLEPKTVPHHIQCSITVTFLFSGL